MSQCCHNAHIVLNKTVTAIKIMKNSNNKNKKQIIKSKILDRILIGLLNNFLGRLLELLCCHSARTPAPLSDLSVLDCSGKTVRFYVMGNFILIMQEYNVY